MMNVTRNSPILLECCTTAVHNCVRIVSILQCNISAINCLQISRASRVLTADLRLSEIPILECFYYPRTRPGQTIYGMF